MVSTRMGDRLGIPRVVGFVFTFLRATKTFFFCQPCKNSSGQGRGARTIHLAPQNPFLKLKRRRTFTSCQPCKNSSGLKDEAREQTIKPTKKFFLKLKGTCTFANCQPCENKSGVTEEVREQTI